MGSFRAEKCTDVSASGDLSHQCSVRKRITHIMTVGWDVHPCTFHSDLHSPSQELLKVQNLWLSIDLDIVKPSNIPY